MRYGHTESGIDKRIKTRETVICAEDGTARKLAQQRKSLHQQSQIGTVLQLLAGGIVGALSKTCTASLARLTILFQVQGMHSNVATLTKASIWQHWQEASRIIGEEGFRAFWKRKAGSATLM